MVSHPLIRTVCARPSYLEMGHTLTLFLLVTLFLSSWRSAPSFICPHGSDGQIWRRKKWKDNRVTISCNQSAAYPKQACHLTPYLCCTAVTYFILFFFLSQVHRWRWAVRRRQRFVQRYVASLSDVVFPLGLGTPSKRSRAQITRAF